MLISLIRMELGKAVKNPWFALALSVGLLLAIMSAVESISLYYQGTGFERSPDKFYPLHLENAFRAWMSVDHRNPASPLFFKLAPLLAALAYSWSIANEKKSGYWSQICTSVSKAKYLAAKCFAAFFAGGLVVALPQLFNFLAVSCFVPMRIPVITDAMYLGIDSENLFSWLFYNIPHAYVAAYLILDFVLCGLWAVLVLTLACLSRKAVLLVSGSYLALAIVQFVNERIFLALGGIKGMQLSLFENLQAHTNMYIQSWDVIVVEGFVLLAAIVLMSAAIIRSDDL